MRDQNQRGIYEMIDVHSCMSKELSRQFKLRENENHRGQLKQLLNEIDSMDSLADCPEPSLEKYVLACKAFFEGLAFLQLEALMLRNIEQAFAADHYVRRVILPRLKRG
ncbi:MAG: hypothetical protein KA508_06785 [Gammaproteobacteria bacterium]|nr:hypothetical protein [Gammaproteobacteria bacterium]